MGLDNLDDFVALVALAGQRGAILDGVASEVEVLRLADIVQ